MQLRYLILLVVVLLGMNYLSDVLRLFLSMGLGVSVGIFYVIKVVIYLGSGHLIPFYYKMEFYKYLLIYSLIFFIDNLVFRLMHIFVVNIFYGDEVQFIDKLMEGLWFYVAYFCFYFVSFFLVSLLGYKLGKKLTSN